MIYALSFNIDGVFGPGGHAHESLTEIIACATPLARVALDQLDDAVSELEWFNLAGDDSDPYKLLLSEDRDEVRSIIAQISYTMKSKELGRLDITEHDDLFRLVEHHNVLTWVPESFRARYGSLQAQYRALVCDLSDEWEAT